MRDIEITPHNTDGEQPKTKPFLPREITVYSLEWMDEHGNELITIQVGDHKLIISMMELITLRNKSTTLINELQEPVSRYVQPFGNAATTTRPE